MELCLGPALQRQRRGGDALGPADLRAGGALRPRSLPTGERGRKIGGAQVRVFGLRGKNKHRQSQFVFSLFVFLVFPPPPFFLLVFSRFVFFVLPFFFPSSSVFLAC